ncbi:MAG: 1-acyl-sn-glycerol-3-phosphate acyltransferase [Bacteroidales bacterium]|nr:1-acyl-sn-glycerol-3-phosphate acyltransferase [Bacteroidales bacterium]
MTDLSEFEDIRPYSDEEAVQALGRVSRHPMLPIISKYLFPKSSVDTLAKTLRSVRSIDEFQAVVMVDVINAVLARTSEGFTFSGTDNLSSINGKFLAVSNHRDIVLDPALILYAMHASGLPFAELCVGSNLLQSPLIEDLMKSNRMIKVIRGISARQMYLNSHTLSKYIRLSITSGTSSIWVAQKEGRAKNGLDKTEQGLLKMFDMSGEKGFEENFKELHIVPMSISYEYEPCDSRKAREILISRDGPYVKRPKEDLHSILTGIRQNKGHIHLSIGKPLTADEIAEAATHTGNDRYQGLRDILNKRIQGGYKLWKTNYMGYDLMNGTSEFLGVKYLPEDLEAFRAYTEHKIQKLERRLDRDALRDIFWHIYGNPVDSSLKL